MSATTDLHTEAIRRQSRKCVCGHSRGAHGWFGGDCLYCDCKCVRYVNAANVQPVIDAVEKMGGSVEFRLMDFPDDEPMRLAAIVQLPPLVVDVQDDVLVDAHSVAVEIGEAHQQQGDDLEVAFEQGGA